MVMIPCYLSQVLIDEVHDAQVVFLHEREGSRRVGIAIGAAEALAIDRALSGQPPARPLTHDLLAEILRALRAEVVALRVLDVRDGVFHAELELRAADGATVRIDCRPSDGLALAVRLRGTGIEVAEAVLAEAGS
jgi:hypothetical protein